MPNDNQESKGSTDIALLAVQLENAVASISRIESKVNDLLAIDRQMATMQQQSAHHEGEIRQVWNRIDGQANSIDLLGQETRAFINKSSGAWVAAAVALGVAQLVICAWVGWVFSSVQFTRELAAVHEHRIKVLEQPNYQTRQQNER